MNFTFITKSQENLKDILQECEKQLQKFPEDKTLAKIVENISEAKTLLADLRSENPLNVDILKIALEENGPFEKELKLLNASQMSYRETFIEFVLPMEGLHPLAKNLSDEQYFLKEQFKNFGFKFPSFKKLSIYTTTVRAAFAIPSPVNPETLMEKILDFKNKLPAFIDQNCAHVEALRELNIVLGLSRGSSRFEFKSSLFEKLKKDSIDFPCDQLYLYTRNNNKYIIRKYKNKNFIHKLNSNVYKQFTASYKAYNEIEKKKEKSLKELL